MSKPQNMTISIGRLTSKPKISMTTNGTKSAWLRLAINMGNNKNGERITVFTDYTVYGATAEFVEKYCNKGDTICVQGEERNRVKEGEQYATTYKVGESVQLIVKYKGNSEQNGNQYQSDRNSSQNGQNSFPALNPRSNYYEDADDLGISDDDLPF